VRKRKQPKNLNQNPNQTSLRLTAFDTLAFAGGGNRCWWQAGFLKRLIEQRWNLPSNFVGTSAGAAVAASFLTDDPDAALRNCNRLYVNNERMFDWRGLAKARLSFAQQHIYPAWVHSFVNAGNFDTLKKAESSLLVAVSRPARALGLSASIAAGTLAYLIDKKIWHSIHPRLPKWLGLRQEFFDIRQCQSVQEAQVILMAAAAAPPILPSLRLGGRWAFDGGYTDNAPIPMQTSEEKAATLVLLTRHYPNRPVTFVWQGRYYWQPSQKVPVSTWDCTHKTTIEDAFALGYDDAHTAIRAGFLHDA
jgi:predicted acylesterase/phospholipase RssA